MAALRPEPAVGLPFAQPALQVCSINDAEHEYHAIRKDDVVHHSVVTDAHAVEDIVRSANRLDGLAGDAPRACDIARETFEGFTNPLAVGAAELLVLSQRRPG